MRTVAEHRAAALGLVAPLPVVEVPIGAAAGLVLARPVVATQDQPRWDNSAMDGYAVRRQDVEAATPEASVLLTVVADLSAGSGEEPVVLPGTAARIMTGAPVPPGADAVVPVEHTDRGTDTVRIDHAPAPGAHIRRVGEDVRAGDVVLEAGAVLGARQVAAAASVGVASLLVHRRPRVAVLSTGSELAEPGTPLGRGRIPDSNSYLLAAAVEAAGATAVRVGAVPDDPARLRAALDEHDGAVDLVVTSGGVSVGAYDVVKAVLAQVGVSFVQVAMQPGKPQGLGLLPRGTPVLCLPGNPVSAFVSFEVVVRPVLRRLAGATDLDRPWCAAVVEDGWRPTPGRQQYMPVVLGTDAQGRTTVRRAVPGGSGSHLVAGLARADGVAVVPVGTEEVRAGQTVRVTRTDG